MLRLDITPVHMPGATCFEDTLITVANWWEKEYLLGFLESWRFEYRRRDDEADERLGDRIRYSTSYEVNNFREFVGIEVKAIRCVHYEDAVTKAKEELANQKPVAIYIDSYWAPWDDLYQKEHFLYHACIVIGIDEDMDMLICLDPFHEIFHPLELPIDHYRRGFGSSMLLFSLSEGNQAVNGPDWQTLLEKAMSVLHGREGKGVSSFKAMEQFAADLEEMLDLSKEFNDSNSLWKSSLYLNLDSAITGRFKFLNVIDYLAIKLNSRELSAFRDRFEASMKNWQVLKNVLLKAYLTKNEDVSTKLANLIREQGKTEENLANDLLEISRKL